MEKQVIYVISGDELHSTLKKVLVEALKELEVKKPDKEYSINQAASYLKLSWSTVNKYVSEGILKTTGTGRITESSIREFLDQH